MTMIRKIGITGQVALAFVGLALLQGLLMVFVTWWPFEQSISRHVFAENHEVASRIADNVGRTFSEKFNLLHVVAENESILSMDETRQDQVLQSIVKNLPEIQLAVLADANGNQIARWDGKPHDPEIHYRDRVYFNQVMKTGQTVVSGVLRAKSTGRLGVVVAAPVKENDGKTRAVLIINIELTRLVDKIQGAKVGNTGYLYVVNGSGEMVIHQKKGLLEHPVRVQDLPPVVEVCKGLAGSMEYTTRDGRRMLASYFPVSGVDWGVVVEQPYGEALAEIQAIRTKEIAVVGSVLLVSALMGILMAVVILRPIRAFTRASQSLADGDYTVRVQETFDGEMKKLASAFNRMAGFISLRQEELENMVADRTRELSQLNEELNQMATIDGLTGLANRRYLDDYIQKEWERSQRNQLPLSVLMIDADFFKNYNDYYGHLQGDEVLKAIALAIQESLTYSTDLCARYGGEEFMVVLPGTDASGGLMVAERIQANVIKRGIPHAGSGVSDILTVSIGATTRTPQWNDTLEDFLNKADKALYISKNQGRNRIAAIE